MINGILQYFDNKRVIYETTHMCPEYKEKILR